MNLSLLCSSPFIQTIIITICQFLKYLLRYSPINVFHREFYANFHMTWRIIPNCSSTLSNEGHTFRSYCWLHYDFYTTWRDWDEVLFWPVGDIIHCETHQTMHEKYEIRSHQFCTFAPTAVALFSFTRNEYRIAGVVSRIFHVTQRSIK